MNEIRLDRDHPLLRAGEGEAAEFAGFGARFMLGATLSDGRFSLVEHPIGPKVLAAPLHTHANEDEHSFIIEGEVGIQLGDDVFTARPGDLVFKPRGLRHAFWNATAKPARILEIISPAGFERYFADLATLLTPGGEPDLSALAELGARYGLQMEFESIPVLAERYGLDLSPSGSE